MDEKYKNPKIIIVLGTLVIFLVIYWFWPFSHLSQKNAMGEPKGIPVTILSVKKQPVDIQKELPGRLVPYQVAEIRPQVTGIISSRLFKEGSEVKEGQPLYQIDAAPYQAIYNKAQADLMKAQANLTLLETKMNRYEKLIAVKAISTEDYDDVLAQRDQAKAEVAVAKAALETTRIDLDYTKVYAPISGYIGKSEVTKGALVTANQPMAIARITQLDPIYADLTESSNVILAFQPTIQSKKNIHVMLVIPNTKKTYPHEGTLEFTDVTVNQTTGSVMLRALFPNPDRTLLPGLFVNAQITLKAVDSILVPQRALIRHPDGSASVWIVDNNNVAKLKTIMVDKAIGDQWLVTDGLQVGDKVIIAGIQKLKTDTLVIPQPQESH